MEKRIEKIGNTLQYAILSLTALGGVIIGLLHSLGYSLEKIPNLPAVSLILLGLISLNLTLDRAMTARRIDRLEEGNIKTNFDALPLEVRKHVVSCLQFCADIYKLRSEVEGEESAFSSLLDDMMENQYILLQHLAAGRLNVPYEHTALTQRHLTKALGTRFEALSESDLEFWIDDRVGEEYFQINARTIRFGAIVNRIFVFSVSDLVRRRREIAVVLEKHDKAGVGWAVAIRDELEADVRLSPLPLDFGIFNGNKAISLFRKRDNRRFEAIFSTPNNRQTIAAHKDLYAKMIAESWMVSSRFKETFAGGLSEEQAEIVDRKSRDSNQKLREALNLEVGEADPFVLQTANFLEIKDKLSELTRIVISYRESRGFDVPGELALGTESPASASSTVQTH